MAATPDPTPLDNPAYAALTGPHAGFAIRAGRALPYPHDVSPWLGAPPGMTPDDWRAAAAALGEDGIAGVIGVEPEDLAGVRELRRLAIVQMVEQHAPGAPAPDAVVLVAPDVPEILELVALTSPGPFLPRTIELGTYLGIRRAADGALLAMAGERLRTGGYTEISAVCTHPEARGQGLAARLVGAVIHGIHARSERAFLHAMASNLAVRLYERLGFVIRRSVAVTVIAP